MLIHGTLGALAAEDKIGVDTLSPALLLLLPKGSHSATAPGVSSDVPSATHSLSSV